jgi:uncharacterized delta-60 repeat protein
MTRSFTKSLTSLKSPTSHRRNRRARHPQAEALEGRLLLNAGDLDTTFGADYDKNGVPDGYVLTNSPAYAKDGTPVGDEAYAVAVYPSTDPNGNAGKILAAGDRAGASFEAVRLLPNGSPDLGFGSGGFVVPLTNGQGYDMTVDTQGRILMTGYVGTGVGKKSNTDVAIVRMLSTGALDTSFGPNRDGKVVTDVSGRGLDDDGQDIVIQPDGKIVVVGKTGRTDSSADGFILRYNADGSPDTSFGSGGKVVSTLMPGRFDRFVGVAIQPIDGKIVVCASYPVTNDVITPWGRYLARYNADGTLDTGFGTGGRVDLPFTPVTSGYFNHPITIQGDGKIVWAEGGVNGTDHDVTVARLTATGSFDTTFGAVSGAARTGYVMIPHAGDDNAASVKIQPDGKLVVVGFWGDGPAQDPFIARLTPDGTLDPGFGSGGIVIHSFSSGSGLDDVAVQGDGKLVAVGSAEPPGLTRPAFLVARFLGDSGPSPAAASPPAPSSPTAISPPDQAMLAPLATSTDLDLTQLATEWLRLTPTHSRPALRAPSRLGDR